MGSQKHPLRLLSVLLAWFTPGKDARRSGLRVVCSNSRRLTLHDDPPVLLALRCVIRCVSTEVSQQMFDTLRFHSSIQMTEQSHRIAFVTVQDRAVGESPRTDDALL